MSSAHDERGLALVLSVLSLAVLAVGVAALITFSSSNLGASSRSNASEAALFAAESGFAEALARLNNAPDPRIGTLLPTTTTTVGAASVTYSGTYDSATMTWTITSTATKPSTVGGTSPVSRTVVQHFQVTPDTALVVDNPAWNYLYADRPDGCTSLNSSVQIKQPLYVKNSLRLNSSVKVFSSAGTVQVGGGQGITMNGSSMMGVAADGSTPEALPMLKVASLGCRYSTQAYAWPCNPAAPSAGQRVLAATQVNAIDPVSKPPIDLAARYLDASPGPMNPCGPGSFGLAANFFDTNTTLDKSAGNRNLMPVSSYDCVTPTGRLRWQAGNPGTLTIQGTIFIDGNIFMNGSQMGVVSGRGTIYLSGQVRLDSSVQICGKWHAPTTSCDWSTWDPETNLLLFVGGSYGGSPAVSIDLASSVRFQGALYGARMIRSNSSVIAQGPQISNELDFNSSVGSIMIPFTTLPTGAPATPKWKVAPVAGTWRET